MRNRLSPRDPEALTRVLAYQRRDARVKCSSCRRWMRYTATSKTPLARRGQPNAKPVRGVPAEGATSPAADSAVGVDLGARGGQLLVNLGSRHLRQSRGVPASPRVRLRGAPLVAVVHM